ncbi:MAG: cytochrome c3 family protein [Acidobacteria bacterium]|nr:cytochrome c3 family protein [Acidobacteriota bacterium]
MTRGRTARRWIHAALTLLGVTLAVAMAVVWNGAAAQEEEGREGTAAVGQLDAVPPGEQPIAFSHARHVEQAGVDCQFCHAYARRGPVAGIPSVERCVGCHRSILTERPEIVKVLDYWEQGTPIPWIRVHDLPDYVRFSHKAHVRTGIDCAECHGDVARMDIASQVESLSMGWCVDCHTAREASRDCLVCHY